LQVHGKGFLGVYVHVPYCASKCPYCDFNSVAVGARIGPHVRSTPGALDEQRYVECVLRELSTVAPGAHILSSIYIGGGTPTLLAPASIERMVKGVAGAFTLSSPVEITVEANPGTIGLEGLKGLKRAGVNRLSIGVQSLSPGVLKALGRPVAEKAIEVYSEARFAGWTGHRTAMLTGSKS